MVENVNSYMFIIEQRKSVSRQDNDCQKLVPGDGLGLDGYALTFFVHHS